MPEWKCGFCEYTMEGQSQGQVKVTTLHYNVSLVEGEFSASSYGTTGDEATRVYTLPALQAVPESVMVGWVQAALGQERVDEIEAALAANIAEQKTPTHGGVTPGE